MAGWLWEVCVDFVMSVIFLSPLRGGADIEHHQAFRGVCKQEAVAQEEALGRRRDRATICEDGVGRLSYSSKQLSVALGARGLSVFAELAR